jgi:hypothetical protein
MKLKFAKILKENLTPRQERYIDVIVNAMKEHFTDESGSVVNNKTIFMENPRIGEYKLKVDIYNEANKKLIELYNNHSNLSRATPKDIREYRKEFMKLNAHMDNSMQYIMNLSSLFGDIVTSYNVPVNALLIAWERFHKEVYIPQQIEDIKSKSKLDGLQHGLPEGNYSKEKYLNSMYGKDRYAVIKDEDNGDYILGINKKWDWFQKGLQLNDLFYKRFQTLRDLKSELYTIETDNLEQELEEVYDIYNADQLIEFIEMSGLSEIEDAWEEEREEDPDSTITFEQYLGEEIDEYLMREQGMGAQYLGRSGGTRVASEFIKLEKLLNDIYNF